ncbi:MAG: sugar kinase [Bacteroidota bacterium]|jgi:D-glycero-alpha-D-manno-heptose-7-phosphate kinase
MGGGGTDLPSYYKKHGGFLIAVAINKYVYIMAEKRFQKTIRLSYSKTEIVDSVDQIEHNIFREALKLMKVENTIELVSIADVPVNCGLGTSSTFTVALINALFAYQRNYVTLAQLAETACHIEIDILKEPIGKQDQYTSTFGGFNAYWFNQDGTVNVEPVNIKEENLIELQSNIFLFYIERKQSASSILSVQNKKTESGDKDTIERLHRIKDMGHQTKKIFEKGDINEFGEILHEHWLTKKGLSDKISDDYIDEVYETARKHGALGGKIMGAGGGGFLLVYCPHNKSKLISEMCKLGLSPMWFTFERDGARIVFNG